MTNKRSTNAEARIDEHIGARLKARRLSMNLSQENLAKSLGITFQQLQKYEKGVNRISGSRLWAVCKALGVEPNYFFDSLTTAGKLGGDDLTVQLNFFLGTPGASALIRAFNQMQPSARSAFMLVAAALAHRPAISNAA